MSLPLFALIAATASSATLTVGPGDYATIDDAVDDAEDGDVIEVTAGTYDENVEINDDITVLGLSGAGATFVTSSGGNLFRINGADVTVVGFTFLADGGRAIDVQGGSLHLSDSVVSGNDTDHDGAGVRGVGADITIERCSFADNQTSGDGAHLFGDAAEFTVSDSTFTGGQADDGGAVCISGGSVMTVQRSTFDGNRSDEDGGAIDAQHSELALSEVTFVGNSAIGGACDPNSNDSCRGGAIHGLDSVVSVTLSEFDGNFTGGNPGGAIDLEEGASGIIGESTFTANEASYGGAIYAADDGDLDVVDCSFEGNSASADGGAIRLRPFYGDPTLSIQNTTFVDNSAAGFGGGIAALADGTRGRVELVDTVFTGNSAESGGAVATGSITDLISVRGYFCDNEAGSNGGVARVAESGTGDHVWTNNVLSENTAVGSGGGLFLIDAGDATILNNDFVSNQATSGGGVRAERTWADFRNNAVAWTGSGGGVSSDASSGTLDYNNWWQNLPSDLAGALGPASHGSGDRFDDPLFAAYSPDGDCYNDGFWLDASSLMIDHGDPAIDDPDGTRSDIGAYGGPEADDTVSIDNDNDGWPASSDCDDNNPSVNPAASEDCNGIDDDCDGVIDDNTGTLTTWYEDADDDGWGGEVSQEACAEPAGYTSESGDCNDNDDSLNPGATELCDDLDQDCDGDVDEGLDLTWYIDVDEDGFGDDEVTELDCAQPDGFVDTGGDCDDEDGGVYPGATDVAGDGIDQDCDGSDGTVDPDTDDTAIDEADTGSDPYAGEGFKVGCACSNHTLPWSSVWLFLPAAAATMRRRH